MASWTIESPRHLTLEEPVEQLDVSLVSGQLNVVAADGPARVEVRKVGSRPVVVEHAGGRLRVFTPRPPLLSGILAWLVGWDRRVRVDVSVAVPRHARADLRLVSGETVVSGLREDTRVDVTAGRVTLLGLGGRTFAKVTSGGVDALGVAGEVTLETTAGELAVADSAAERLDARTVSGTITCDLDNPQHSDIRLGAISGTVTVRVRRDSDLAVHLQTVSGRITSAFPELHAHGRVGSQEARGVLGAGVGTLAARTTSGTIALLARPVAEEEAGRS